MVHIQGLQNSICIFKLFSATLLFSLCTSVYSIDVFAAESCYALFNDRQAVVKSEEPISKDELVSQSITLVENLRNSPIGRIFPESSHARVFRAYHHLAPEAFQSKQWAFLKTDSDLYVAPNKNNLGFAVRKDKATNDITGLIIEAVVPIDIIKKPPFTRIDLSKLPEQDMAPYIEKFGVVRVETLELKALIKKYGSFERARLFILTNIKSGDSRYVEWFEVRKIEANVLSEIEFLELQQFWASQPE